MEGEEPDVANLLKKPTIDAIFEYLFLDEDVPYEPLNQLFNLTVVDARKACGVDDESLRRMDYMRIARYILDRCSLMEKADSLEKFMPFMEGLLSRLEALETFIITEELQQRESVKLSVELELRLKMLPLRTCLEEMDSMSQKDGQLVRFQPHFKKFIQLRDKLLGDVNLRDIGSSEIATIVQKFQNVKKASEWRKLYLESEEFKKTEALVLLKKHVRSKILSNFDKTFLHEYESNKSDFTKFLHQQYKAKKDDVSAQNREPRADVGNSFHREGSRSEQDRPEDAEELIRGMMDQGTPVSGSVSKTKTRDTARKRQRLREDAENLRRDHDGNAVEDVLDVTRREASRAGAAEQPDLWDSDGGVRGREGEQIRQQRTSLFEPQESAEAIRFTETTEDLTENEYRMRLPKMATVTVPPLSSPQSSEDGQKVRSKPGVRGARRIRKFWTIEEDKELKRLNRMVGKGRWKKKKDLGGDIFRDRTPTDLKDRTRNLEKISLSAQQDAIQQSSPPSQEPDYM